MGPGSGGPAACWRGGPAGAGVRAGVGRGPAARCRSRVCTHTRGGGRRSGRSWPTSPKPHFWHGTGDGAGRGGAAAVAGPCPAGGRRPRLEGREGGSEATPGGGGSPQCFRCGGPGRAGPVRRPPTGGKAAGVHSDGACAMWCAWAWAEEKVEGGVMASKEEKNTAQAHTAMKQRFAGRRGLRGQKLIRERHVPAQARARTPALK